MKRPIIRRTVSPSPSGQPPSDKGRFTVGGEGFTSDKEKPALGGKRFTFDRNGVAQVTACAQPKPVTSTAEKECAATISKRAEIQAERKKHESPIKITYADDGVTMLAAENGLVSFIRYFWNEVEPGREYKEGWAIWAIALHLEACIRGDMARLAINVSPGSMKSLTTAVFFPAHTWATYDATKRFISFSYGAHLTQRDNSRFTRLLESEKFQAMYPEISLVSKGKIKVENSLTGWKFASSVGGVGTGERGDCLLIDDSINVSDADSKIVLQQTRDWFTNAVSNRLNDMDKSSIVVIGQRVHEGDTFGVIRDRRLPYEHLVIPCEYEPDRHHSTSIWTDPRSIAGECFFPERFSPRVVEECKSLGPAVWAQQYQQRPELDSEAVFPRELWRRWSLKKFPKFKHTLACLDLRLDGESSITIWGSVKDSAMLMYAWRKKLTLKGKHIKRGDDETFDEYRIRTQEHWGIAEHATDDCRRFKANRLIVYVDKISSLTTAEFAKSIKTGIPVEYVEAEPDEDYVNSVQHVIKNGQIYCPKTGYAELVVSECAMYPYGERDGLVKSACRSWSWLRQHGYLPDPSEVIDKEKQIKYYRPKRPLYPVCG